jgi:glutamate formiminotransferase
VWSVKRSAARGPLDADVRALAPLKKVRSIPPSQIIGCFHISILVVFAMNIDIIYVMICSKIFKSIKVKKKSYSLEPKFGTKAQFSSPRILQNFSHSPSYRIFGRMHEALNINKK